MHTNYDVLGMAELSGQILGLTDTEVLDVTMNTQTKEEGIGRVGSLPKEMTLEECCVYVKHKLKLGSVKVFGDMKQPVKDLRFLRVREKCHCSGSLKRSGCSCNRRYRTP